MLFHVDYNSNEPICQQAVEQIKLLVVSGSLTPGDRLPSIRQLASEAHINPTTVSRIYSQLAHEGVVALRQGQGVFVTDGSARLAPEEVRRVLGRHARALLVEGLRQGLSIEQIRRTLDDEYDAIRGDDE
jgi:GntR family transcriptional regulator